MATVTIVPTAMKRTAKTITMTTTNNSTSNSSTILTTNDIVKELHCPNFHQLAMEYPEFQIAYQKQKQLSQRTTTTFEFNSSLTRSILQKYFQLRLPCMPKGYLCPPVLNRLHYVLWIKELVSQCKDDNVNYFDSTKQLCQKGLDLGTGVSAIYLLLLSTQHFSSDKERWTFVGTDIDHYSVKCAQNNIQANQLQDRIQIYLVPQTTTNNTTTMPAVATPTTTHEATAIKIKRNNDTKEILKTKKTEIKDNTNNVEDNISAAVRQQKDDTLSMNNASFMTGKSSDTGTTDHNNTKGDKVVGGPIQAAMEAVSNNNKAQSTKIQFDFCMTNPPFFNSMDTITIPIRSSSNNKRKRMDMTVNEGFYPNNGEVGFIQDMIQDSYNYFKHDFFWFTAMIGQKTTLQKIQKELYSKIGLPNWFTSLGSIRATTFDQGKIRRWGIAWTFQSVSIRSLGTRQYI